jgi:hypothetical protein
MKTHLKTLSSGWFLLALALLLLNDFFLKTQYGNWWTGKLSDFAGVFAFAWFWLAILPRYQRALLLLIGLLFIFWKSPLSQPLIDGWNQFGFLPVSRVVDYTDLMALAMLPLACWASKGTGPRFALQLQPIIPIIVAAFAFLATSRVPVSCTWGDKGVYQIEIGSRDSLIQKLDQLAAGEKFSIYRDTAVQFTYVEIRQLTDSLETLNLHFDNFNRKKGTAQVSLWCWQWKDGDDSHKYNKEKLESRRAYIQKAFEETLIERLKGKRVKT